MNHISLIHFLDDTTNLYLGQNSNVNDYLKEISNSLVSHFSNVNDYLKEISNSLVSHLTLEDFVIYFRHNSKNRLRQIIKANHSDGSFIPRHDYIAELGKGIVGSSAY